MQQWAPSNFIQKLRPNGNKDSWVSLIEVSKQGSSHDVGKHKQFRNLIGP